MKSTTLRRIRRNAADTAYTLPELLITIGIVALLAGVLLPMLGGARDRARTVECISNLRQIGVALTASFTSAGKLPDAGQWQAAVMDGASGSTGILRCPEDPRADQQPYPSGFTIMVWNGVPAGSNPNGARSIPLDHPWRVHTNDLGPSHYQLSVTFRPDRGNHFTDDMTIDMTALGGDQWRATIVQLAGSYRVDIKLTNGQRLSFVRAGQSFPVSVAAGLCSYAYNLQASNLRTRLPDKVLAMDYRTSIFDYDGLGTDDDVSLMAPRHRKRVNALFADGSVRSLELPQLDATAQIYALGPHQTYAGPSIFAAAAIDTTGGTASGTSGNVNGPGNGNGHGHGGGNGNGRSAKARK